MWKATAASPCRLLLPLRTLLRTTAAIALLFLTPPAPPTPPFSLPVPPPPPDTQLDALTREMENGRLFRLVSKLAFVTDRQTSDGPGGLGGGGSGGDTGNAYLLSLFRDFVFHQGEREGGRVIDWGHILENLNKV